VWLIQIPRLYNVYRDQGIIENFAQVQCELHLKTFRPAVPCLFGHTYPAVQASLGSIRCFATLVMLMPGALCHPTCNRLCA
jgi:hypothetical protein